MHPNFPVSTPTLEHFASFTFMTPHLSHRGRLLFILCCKQVDNMPVDFHLSETNGSCWARTWVACMTEDGNNYAIPLTHFHIRKKLNNTTL